MRSQDHDLIDHLPVLGKRKYLIKSHIPDADFDKIKSFLLANHERIPLSYLSNHIGVSYNTVVKWFNELLEDPNYDPKHTLTNRSMSDSTEDCLMCFIEEEFLDNNYFFNNGMLKTIALKFLEFAPAADKMKTVFAASDTWCKEFRQRHKYVWRKAHLSRRPVNREQLQNHSSEFTDSIRKVIEEHRANETLFMVANMDETSWKITYPGVFTWAKRGAKEVKVRINYNTKQNVTSLATIIADPNLKNYHLLYLQWGKQMSAKNNSADILDRYKMSFIRKVDGVRRAL
jgi:hypothetical protein